MIKVLIVEDEKLTRQGLIMTVNWENLGCELIGDAINGKDGAEKIRKFHPDLVITDIRMPVMSGIDMMKTVGNESDCFYIILSGYDDFRYCQEAMRLGAKDYLVKPIDDDEFIEVITKNVAILEKRNREQSYIRTNEQKPFLTTYQNKYVSNAYEIIRNRYREDLTIRDVADTLNISDSYLEKLIRTKTNYTFRGLVALFRIKAAITLLETTDLKVYTIANEVGYVDSKYFSKIFQKLVGIKPTEYRKGYHLSEDNVLDHLGDIN